MIKRFVEEITNDGTGIAVSIGPWRAGLLILRTLNRFTI
jgi:hypothetical protein